MRMRKFGDKTQSDYQRAVRNFAKYPGRSRVNEVVSLKVGDIDSQRMTLRVERGKGQKDRYAMLSPILLERLRVWWRVARTQGRMLDGGWLFPDLNPIEPLSARQLNRAIHLAAEQAGIEKRVSMHSLRHAFATHLLEQKVGKRHRLFRGNRCLPSRKAEFPVAGIRRGVESDCRSRTGPPGRPRELKT